jgi:four helix bundle suffix protein
MDTTEKTTPTTELRKEKRLRPNGGYRRLRSFQLATIIYDATVSFCNRCIDRRSRTHDQMVQAARSGRQNIAEASRAGATSSKSETHLTNVARSSLDELLLDYEDFLRQRKLRQWAKDDKEAQEVRTAGLKKDYDTSADQAGRNAAALYAPWLDHVEPAVAANALICLIHQANYLLDQQLIALEKTFIKEGGYSEQLAAARIAEREEQKKRCDQTDLSDRTDKKFPVCPMCGKLMVLRTARQGKKAGLQFWGCSGYPDCRGTRPCEKRPARERAGSS